jgi:hypothetical protein
MEWSYTRCQNSPNPKAEEEAAAATAKTAVASSPQPPKKRGRGKAVKSKGKTKTVKEDDTPFAIISKYKSAVSTSAATAGGATMTAAESESTTQRKVATPYKYYDLVPLLISKFKSDPNASNDDMKEVLKPYGNIGVFTESLLQNTRKAVRKELYGTASDNVQYAYHLKYEMERRGHPIRIHVANRKETKRAMEEVVWAEELARRGTTPKASIRTGSRTSFCKQWVKENGDKIYHALGDKKDNLEFLHGIVFAPSVSVQVVPHLQKVFQADAAHVAWGKNTLYSLYGTTANGNMFAVAIGLFFGNENYENWCKFWDFAVATHPSLNHPEVTIITDQCKGSIGAIKKFAPSVVNFHCTFHRLDNVIKKCKGGKTKHSSPHWIVKTLIGCNNVATLNYKKEKLYAGLPDDMVRYFDSVADEAQFPAARCAMGKNIFLYDHEASSGVESMNNASKTARQMAAVDPTNSVLLILQQESVRYQKWHKAVWKWDTSLTPKGETLCHDAFEVLVSGNYTYDVTEVDDHYETEVRSVGGVGGSSICSHTVMIPREAVNGTRFGSCTCGIAQTKTVPCVHMVAIVQAKVITGLNEVDVMPAWCASATWQLQYPRNLSIRADLNIHKLKAAHQSDTKLHCCPKTAAGNKSGAPKKVKRVKGPLEKKRKRRQRMGLKMVNMDGIGDEDKSNSGGEDDLFGRSKCDSHLTSL